jgi:putative chitinase
MSIQLLNVIKYFSGLKHQIDAIKYLQDNIPADVLKEFETKFRDSSAGNSSLLVSKSQLEYIWNRSVSDFYIKELNNCLVRFDINTKSRIVHFMAQISHECGAGRWMKELSSGRQYEWRSDLGNNQAGDGSRFKGAGVIQLTGRYNYSQFAKFINDPEVMRGCDYVAEKYPFTSGGFWWHSNRMNALVDSGASCRRVSARVNGRDPANGLSDREYYFQRANTII